MQLQGQYEERPSGWAVGSIMFAAVTMIMMGIWWIFAGLVALFDDRFYYVVNQEWIYKLDTTTWGWVHIGLGIVITLAGFGLFSGATWARIVGVVLATLGALIAFAWLPVYPIWAIIFIAVSVLVIWALIVHGRAVTRV